MRVKLKTKNKGIKVETYPCRKCEEPIKPGEQYYEWKHRNSPFSRQHQSHGAPKQSELCSGKMSGVYAATEELSDVIDAASRDNNPSSLADALMACAEAVREVAQEYEDNRGNMPEGLQDGNVGTDMQEKADALNDFADSLESAASDSEVTDWEMDTESPEPGEDHTEGCSINDEGDNPECDCGYAELEEAKDAWEQDRDDKIQAAIDCAQNALDELSI
jgi:hypothetical protein